MRPLAALPRPQLGAGKGISTGTDVKSVCDCVIIIGLEHFHGCEAIFAEVILHIYHHLDCNL